MYKQTTYETCLAVALMLLLKIKPTHSKEIIIWQAGWEFNFLIGQLNYVCAKYQRRLVVYIENRLYLKKLKQEAAPQVILNWGKIDEELIDAVLKQSRLIIYLDNYYLQKMVHAPHFILIKEKKGSYYIVFDPWDGKQKKIAKKQLLQAIKGLKTLLKFSPVLIAA